MKPESGRQFEVFQPTWGKDVLFACMFLIFGISFLFSRIIFFKLFALFFLGGSGWYTYLTFQKKNSGLWFYEGGLRIKNSKIDAWLALDKIERFDWECREIDNSNGFSTQRTTEISFSLSGENEKSEFVECLWTEEFPAGSVMRLQRACDRMQSLEYSPKEQKQEDEYWDE